MKKRFSIPLVYALKNQAENIFTAIVGICLAFTFTSAAITDVSAKIVEEAATDAQLEALLKGDTNRPDLTGVALAVMVDGEIIYQGAAGCAQLSTRTNDGCARPMRVDTKVRVASISKMALAMGLHSMVADGIIALDTDVSEYLGWPLGNPNYPDTPITVRQVLSHTSSLRDPQTYWALAPASFRSLFTSEKTPFANASDGIDAAPGAYFTYANLNSGILASVMESATGKRFDKIMNERVFLPLKLDVGYNWFGVSRKARRTGATLYRREKDLWTVQKDGRAILRSSKPDILSEPGVNHTDFMRAYQPGENASLFSPQGGLRASVRDLAVLADAMADISVMQKPSWQVNAAGTNGNTENQFFTAYGLGTHLIKGTAEFHPGFTFTGHPGEAYGLYSGAWHVRQNTANSTDPKISIAFVVTGTAQTPGAGRHPSFNAVEQELMDAGMAIISIAHASDKPSSSHSSSHTKDEPRPYHKDRNAMADVDKALQAAQISRRKPLLVLGANWCHDSRGLAARFEHPRFQSLISENYELVYVDVGKRDRNLDVASRFGIHGLIGTPTVLILSPEGELLNATSVSKWKRAASISDDETFDYFTTFAMGQEWQDPTNE